MTVLKSAIARPSEFEDRYRLYLDESGDHVYRKMADPPHRFLCLLGCWFRNPEYLAFHQALETLKNRYLPNHPDRPVILHREDMINRRGPFKIFQDDKMREAFDQELLAVMKNADFRIVAVVIDKYELWRSYGDTAQHPYHLALGFMLQRYAGYLNHINRVGDVMAESRGKTEDRLLADAFTDVYGRGAWMVPAHSFQSALSSRQLKFSSKNDNISGLQLADLLGHPVKQWALLQHEQLGTAGLAPFAQQVMAVVESKLNRHSSKGQTKGYGYVIYPKK